MQKLPLKEKCLTATA
ncbi:TPA: protein YmiD, partial [Escherichia coli]